VDRRDLASLAGFFVADEPIVPGGTLTLGEDAAHHMRVRRLGVGERVRVTDGAGSLGVGTIVRLVRATAAVQIDEVEHVEAAPAIHLLVPVADRERMLWLAEKSVELGAASWRPVMWRRSRSVSPRGEGTAFGAKVRLRMIAALTQSGGAWLPAIFPDAPIGRAIPATSAGTKVVLDGRGDPMLSIDLKPPVSLAVGPEGGFEEDELESLLAADFRRASLASTVLRFETAVVAAHAVARAALGASKEPSHGR
jgi:16S rRNA (uracil1498-N3)-methyltransferase